LSCSFLPDRENYLQKLKRSILGDLQAQWEVGVKCTEKCIRAF
jgi:hypothetical protein